MVASPGLAVKQPNGISIMLKRINQTHESLAECAKIHHAQKAFMSAAPPFTIVSVDPHPLLRRGLASVIAAETDLRLVAETDNGAAALELYRSLRPDLLLTELRLPDMHGLQLIAAVRGICPPARIVVLCADGGEARMLRAMKAGASGYLLKDMPRTRLLDALRLVLRGGRCIPAAVAALLDDGGLADGLSRREVEVLQLAALGNTNRLIGVALGLAEQTIKVHMKSILSKMAARDRTHAVSMALGRGVIEPHGAPPYS